jgi:S1-C subfamily serine protease
VDQLVRFGKVTRPILGIKFAPDQSVEQLGVSGVLVLDAPANGPAGKAVLKHITYFRTLLFCAYLVIREYMVALDLTYNLVNQLRAKT